MIKYKKYGYWYSNWNTMNVKASNNRRLQWWTSLLKTSQIISEFKN